MNTWSQNIPINMLRPNTNSKLVPLRILSFPKPSVQVLRKASSSSLKVQSGQVYFKLYIDHVLYFLGLSGRVKLAPKVKAADTSSKEVLTPWWHDASCLISCQNKPASNKPVYKPASKPKAAATKAKITKAAPASKSAAKTTTAKRAVSSTRTAKKRLWAPLNARPALPRIQYPRKFLLVRPRPKLHLQRKRLPLASELQRRSLCFFVKKSGMPCSQMHSYY